jgi:hypothetical protein
MKSRQQKTDPMKPQQQKRGPIKPQQQTDQMKQQQQTTDQMKQQQQTTDQMKQQQQTTDQMKPQQQTTDKMKPQQQTTDQMKQQQQTTDQMKQQQQTTDQMKSQQPTTDQMKQQQQTTDQMKQQQQTTDRMKELQQTTDRMKQQQQTTDQMKQRQQTTDQMKSQQPTTDKMKPQQQTTFSNNPQILTHLKKQGQQTTQINKRRKTLSGRENELEEICAFSRPHRIKKKRNSKTEPAPAETKLAATPRKISSFFKIEKSSVENIYTPPQKLPATKSTNEQVELFPLLGPGIDWYKRKGVNAVTNISRSEEQSIRSDEQGLKYVALGSVKGTIKENIDKLVQKLSDAGSERQQQHFEAMITLGNYIIEMGPIVPTQSLAAKYKEIKGSTAKRITSSSMLRVMAKHLNVAQIYINGTGYILENPGKEMLDLFGCLENISSTDEKIIKQKVEKVVGDDFGIICEYLDSKRDRDTLKAILTKLTSSTFMAKLANVQDKRAFQRAKHRVNANIQAFKEMKKEVEESVELKGEAGRRKKCTDFFRR